MRYFILFLIGIIFYFIITKEHFNVGGQKLITPDFPKVEWRGDDLYYRVSDGSCRLGLLADRYDNSNDIKEILSKTKFSDRNFGRASQQDTKIQYIKEYEYDNPRVPSLHSRTVEDTRYLGYNGDIDNTMPSLKTDGVFLPKHNTYGIRTGNVTFPNESLLCTKPNGNPLQYQIKCKVPSIYYINMHGRLPPPILDILLTHLTYDSFSLGALFEGVELEGAAEFGQRTFKLPPNVTIISYVDIHHKNLCQAGELHTGPVAVCTNLTNPEDQINKPIAFSDNQAFGLFRGEYLEILLSKQQSPSQEERDAAAAAARYMSPDVYMPSLIKCGTTESQNSAARLHANPDILVGAGSENEVYPIDIQTIQNNEPFFSRRNLEFDTNLPDEDSTGHGLLRNGYPEQGIRYWYLSKLVQKIVSIDAKIHGENNPIEIHLFTCHALSIAASGAVPASGRGLQTGNTRYHDGYDKLNIIKWLSHNRLDPRPGGVDNPNKQYAVDNINIVDAAGNVVEQAGLSAVKTNIERECKTCTFPNQEGVEKERCPDNGLVINEYKTDHKLRYNAIKDIRESECTLACQEPLYYRPFFNNDVITGKCKAVDRSTDYKGYPRLGSDLLGSDLESVRITCRKRGEWGLSSIWNKKLDIDTTETENPAVGAKFDPRAPIVPRGGRAGVGFGPDIGGADWEAVQEAFDPVLLTGGQSCATGLIISTN